MEAIAAALAETAVAEAMRTGRWTYAAASGAHVLGISLLVGAIATLDLRLLGAWPGLAVAALARALVPVAAAGLALAAATGTLLFLAGPGDYLALPLFAAKIGLIVLGTAHAVGVHARGGLSGPPARLRRIGAVSLLIWLAVLACGRLLAFVE